MRDAEIMLHGSPSSATHVLAAWRKSCTGIELRFPCTHVRRTRCMLDISKHPQAPHTPCFSISGCGTKYERRLVLDCVAREDPQHQREGNIAGGVRGGPRAQAAMESTFQPVARQPKNGRAARSIRPGCLQTAIRDRSQGQARPPIDDHAPPLHCLNLLNHAVPRRKDEGKQRKHAQTTGGPGGVAHLVGAIAGTG